MYIQPNFGKEKGSLQIPKNYSGTAVVPHATASADRERSPALRQSEAKYEKEADPPFERARGGANPLLPPEKPDMPPTGAAEPPPAGGKEPFPDGEPHVGGTGTAPPHAYTSEKPPDEAPVFAGTNGKKLTPSGGILNFHALASRFPFLSSLLPPRRKDRQPKSNNDLLLVLGVILLISGEQDDDFLPLLLILLLL